jgi:ribosomal protein L29
MALDARSRSSIYQNLVPILGEHDANLLMSEFPSVEADELVTKQFLRAELAELRAELRGEMAELRAELHGEMAGLRGEMVELRLDVAQALHRQTVMLGSALAGATALLAGLGALG